MVIVIEGVMDMPSVSYQLSAYISAARIAQSVEHQTFNLRVQGSSPCSGGAIVLLLGEENTSLPFFIVISKH